jgi:hypothetical protein
MTNPMKGKPLSWNSQEMTALAAYVQSLPKVEGEAMHKTLILKGKTRVTSKRKLSLFKKKNQKRASLKKSKTKSL